MSLLRVWRICAVEHAGAAFSGEGARRYGGRWTTPGLPAVYASESRALATLEVLAHVDDRRRLADRAWVCLEATLPAELVEKPARVPDSWRRYPQTQETQAFGTAWLRSARTVALRVPSALVPGEFNYLLNPAHPQFAKVRISPPEPFSLDPRLAARRR
ncbi:MAG: RES domain-containing protein [Verrucomicrobia bacterium]|nr:RES domain-containing protein [Verrucomicrobiota bacterium]